MQVEPLKKKNLRPVVAGGFPWVGHDFVKDTGKLRSRERYWHSTHDETSRRLLDTRSSALGLVEENAATLIVPDALSWRKYLQLFKYLVNGDTPPELKSAAFVLLESVVEYMDYRNQSAAICSTNGARVTNEMAAPQERSTLQKLIVEGKLLPFCDLSVRTDTTSANQQEDEWNWLHYRGLTIDSRSRFALLRAARCLQEIQPGLKEVILLVDGQGDDDGLRADDGVRVESVESFLQTFGGNEQSDHISCFIKTCRDEYDKRNAAKEAKSQALLDNGLSDTQEYWFESRVSEGLQRKILIRGRLNFTKENPKEGFVRADGKHWFIDARAGYHNRAIHQDFVILQPLPENEWGRPIGKRRLVFTKDDDDANTTTDGRSLSYPTFPSARVVAIETMSRRSFVATMVDIPMPDESAAIVVPMDIRIPKIRLPTKLWQQFVGKRLLVEVDAWDIGSNYPHGRVLETLGNIGDLETEVKCLLCENQVRLQPFSLAARACLPEQGVNWTIPSSELENRRDLRNAHCVFSVDPVGCQDIDDAMSVHHLPSGDVEIGVHIADVTHFVALNSALDREARARGTTFYLVDRRFDMLPSLLSSNLCSLHGQTDRLAVSVIWTLSSDLETIKLTWYGRTIIHNVAAMTYEQAANILDGRAPEKAGEEPPPPLTAGSPVRKKLIPQLKKDLGLLTTLARKRRKTREDVGGAVDLSSGDIGGELKFTIVDGKPVAVKPKQDLEIHHTIAELMIFANTSVAAKIYDRFPGSALLRIHQEVSEDRFDDLKEMLVAGNLKLDGKSNMELAESLKKAENKSVPVVAALFRSLATRAMSEALYVSTGDTKEGQDLGHYGLGLSTYTHFTSPIRRYADVVVHHQLLASLIEPKEQHIETANNHATVALPDSAVVSMLKGKPETDAEKDDLIRGTAELVVGNGAAGTGAEAIGIDDLIDGAASALLNEDNEAAGTSSEAIEAAGISSEAIAIDDLIGGAASMHLDEDNDAEGTSQESTGIDDLIDGAAFALLNEDNEAAVTGSEAIDIDDLIGGAASTFLDEDNEAAGTGAEAIDLDDLIGGAASTLLNEDTNADNLIGEATTVLVGEAASSPNLLEQDEAFDEGIKPTNPARGGETSLTAKTSREVSELCGPLNSTQQARPNTIQPQGPFLGAQVSQVCERLNLHNRLAKQCSFDCQALFLSLFFKEQVESAQAVVVTLRENGFVAHVPRFDLRLPVFLQDSDGFVQMDPSLLNLQSGAGDDPTVGFARSKFCRRFKREDAELLLTDGEKLEIRVGGAACMILRPLDVVQVEIFCSDWDQRARVPTPRAHLVQHNRQSTSSTSVPTSEKSFEKALLPRVGGTGPPTLFDTLQMAISSPTAVEPKKATMESRVEHLRGRIVFGEYSNPNTRQATQLLAQAEAAAEAQARWNNAIQNNAKREEYTSTRRIEREVTVRMQRLEKQKRETRRAKRQG